MTMRCLIARRKVMAYFDGSPGERHLGAELLGHLSECRRCGGLYGRYQDFVGSFQDSFNRANHELGAPDFGFLTSMQQIVRRPGKRKRATFALAAAVAFFAIAAGFGVFFTVETLIRRSIIREEAVRFAETLFDQPLFAERSINGDDLLLWPDILSELILPLPQTVGFPDA